MTESTGRAFNAGDEHTSGASFYIRFLLCQLRLCPNTIFQQVFGYGDLGDASERLFPLMTLILARLKLNRQVSVDELVELATNTGALQLSCSNPGPDNLAARRLIIAAFGWTTMLYTTHLGPTPNANELTLNAEPAKAFSVAQDLDYRAQRPLLEILGTLGGGLTVRAEGEQATHAVRLPTSADPAEDALHVSCLNAATLCKIGNVEFCWVKCMGSHLDFDVAERRLNVFCLPSFCQLNRLADTNVAR